MGSAQMQGTLWGSRPTDWAELGEPVSRPAFEAVYARAGVGRGTRVADLGCGAGTALVYARSLGAEVAGLDASAPLIEIARSRLPGARIEVGDLEELPFDDHSFDVVTGFNSFQFAGDIPRALSEAARVCKPGGSVTMCVWGLKDECESVATTIAAMMALAPPPPPPPNARPPLGTPGVVEGLLRDAGLDPVTREAAEIAFAFPDVETAWRAFASAGMTEMVIRKAGEEAARKAALDTLGPFIRPDGSVLQRNRFYWTMAAKRR